MTNNNRATFTNTSTYRRRNANSYPLRKIVGREPENAGYSYPRIMEVLECGHKMMERQDAFGTYQATRRRCRQCYQEGRS